MSVALYVNLALTLMSVSAILFTGIGFTFLTELSVKSWLLFAISVALTIGDQTTKFIALKYQEASKL